MAINYAIEADVVDINSDTPKKSDVFLVDTNVWFWMTYSSAGIASNPYQLSDYPKYVNTALEKGARVCRTGFSLAELSHRIEETEHEIYKNYVKPMDLKEYRHNLPAERTRIVSEVQAAWGQVKSLAEPLALTIDEPATDASLARFQTEKVDGYDLFILETLAKHGLIQIITDDGDFATSRGIQVFTANRNVLKFARAQHKLVTR